MTSLKSRLIKKEEMKISIRYSSARKQKWGFETGKLQVLTGKMTFSVSKRLEKGEKSNFSFNIIKKEDLKKTSVSK